MIRLLVCRVNIKIEPIAKAVPKLGPAFKRVKVNVVVLDCPPQPRHENIVLAPASVIHAGGNAVALKQTRKALAGKLIALVGIEYFWSDVAPGSLGERLDTEVGLHGIGHPPGEHLAAVPVHDRYQVHETPAHGDVRYIGRPYLVRPVNCQAPQQVRLDLVLQMRPAGLGLWVNGFQTHKPHQTLNTLPIDFIAQSAQMVSHRA